MKQSYGEYESSRSTHKMRGVMRGVWIVLKGAGDKDYSKNGYQKIIEKFFDAWSQKALCVESKEKKEH